MGMDSSTGEIKRLTREEEAALEELYGRPLKPGDRIDERRVVVSRRVAAKARLANRAERHHHEKRRTRRKRTEARNRARTAETP
jgi:hypothetical protein